MERRLTAILLPVLVVVLGLLLLLDTPQRRPQPASPPTPAAEPLPLLGAAPPGAAMRRPQGKEGQGKSEQGKTEQEPSMTIDKVFGDPDEPGSLWVEFDRRSASIRIIRLLDEPAKPEYRGGDRREFAQRYAAVEPVQEGLVSLSLEEASGAPKLGVNLFTAAWQSKEIEHGLRFTLEDPKTGLVLEKTYRYEKGWRGLLMTLGLRAIAGRSRDQEATLPTGSTASLKLHGISLVNPAHEHVLRQNPAIAICVPMPRGDESVEPTVIRPGGKEATLFRGGDAGVDFVGTTNRFFGAFLVPDDDAARKALWSVEVERWPNRLFPNLEALDDHADGTVPVLLCGLHVPVPAPGAATELPFRIYVGPKSSEVFDQNPQSERFEPVVAIDLKPVGCGCIPGVRQMAGLLLWVLRQIHGIVGSWGLAIIILTLLVRGSLVPLNFRMQVTMRAYGARMSKVKPAMDRIKQQYKDRPKELQQALVQFQKENKLFPPLGGCLPMLVTIPVFLGLYTSLRVAYDLRAQPFLGWITDLSAPDHLFELSFWPYQFNILPFLMMGLWFLLQRGTPLPSDPQQRQMMKIMRFMPMVFGVMLYKYASGLMVYMICSSLFGLTEQRVTRKILGPPPTDGVAMPTTF